MVDWKIMTMKYGAKCCKCGGDIGAGEPALYFKEPNSPRGWHFMHRRCGEFHNLVVATDEAVKDESTLNKLKNNAKWRLAA